MLETSQEAHGDAPEADRISNMPAQVIELILSYMPVRDIVRSSILSTDWRYRWATVPKLVFHGSCFSPIKEGERLARIIDHVLLLHTGSIEIFKLEGIDVTPNLGRWVLHVCRRSIKELVLYFIFRDDLQHYELPSCLCHCESLVELRLSNCFLTLAPRFDGLKNLKCLLLEDVTLEEGALEKLISSCPLLEELTFIDHEQSYDNLKIDARNLQCLDIRGEFRNITLAHAMDRLVVFSFEQFPGVDVDLETSLTEILAKLPSIQRFVLKEGSLYPFPSGLTPESVPIQRKDLYHLSIPVDFSLGYECLAALYLFRCSPNLTELEIKVVLSDSAVPGLWGDIGKCNLEFKTLRWVKVGRFNNVSNIGGVLEFIQFLLASSPVLEKITLSPSESCYVKWEVAKKICGFKRASPEAKIIYDGLLIQKCP